MQIRAANPVTGLSLDAAERRPQAVASVPERENQMRRPSFLIAFLVLLAGAPTASGADRIDIGSGTYRVHEPASWDGTSPLPLLMFFHGYGQTGGVVMGNAELMELADREGVLVIAPDGAEKRWAHQGAPAREGLRDDDAFVAAVLSDAKRRWPVDDARVWASGFSIGGSMAWHLACYRGDLFSAFLPTAGAFWRPEPETCPSGPANLMHVHGTADTVVPMAGRPIRDVYHQGDVLRGIASWRATNGCPAEPAEVSETGSLRCEIWRGCASGKQMQLCLHPGGHVIPEGYMAKAIAWAEALSQR